MPNLETIIPSEFYIITHAFIICAMCTAVFVGGVASHEFNRWNDRRRK